MEKEKQEVVVVDVKMPFVSMVVFMVKLALAAGSGAGCYQLE